jgi:acyl-CoA hydrolase
MTTNPITQVNTGSEFKHSFTVFPDNLNYAGTLFGGKLLSEIDTATSNAARRLLYSTRCDNLVTVKGEIDFKSPGNLGDIVEINCCIKAVGRTSITVDANVTREGRNGIESILCTATFVFVGLLEGKPYPHNLQLN